MRAALIPLHPVPETPHAAGSSLVRQSRQDALDIVTQLLCLKAAGVPVKTPGLDRTHIEEMLDTTSNGLQEQRFSGISLILLVAERTQNPKSGMSIMPFRERDYDRIAANLDPARGNEEVRAIRAASEMVWVFLQERILNTTAERITEILLDTSNEDPVVRRNAYSDLTVIACAFQKKRFGRSASAVSS